MSPRTRNRLVLLLLALLFAVPLVAAFVLRASDWRPGHSVAHGVLIEPPRDLRGVAIELIDGTALDWRDPRAGWTLLALPGTHCAAQCRARLDEALRLRLTLGRNAPRLRLLYLGPPLPADFVTSRAPLLVGRDASAAFVAERARGDDALALALVDPQGRLMLRYPEDYAALEVRQDLVRIMY
jgi:hypothetical protein